MDKFKPWTPEERATAQKQSDKFKALQDRRNELLTKNPNLRYNPLGSQERDGAGFGEEFDSKKFAKPPEKSKKPRKPRKPKTFVQKLAGRKSSRAALGLGARPKRLRKRSFKQTANRIFAFVGFRYTAKAIARYRSYANRYRRSIPLRKRVRKINDAAFMVKQYLVNTDTNGNNPYSCTCPDFTQIISTDFRTWKGSNAGPFNPCKHMMAVRDRKKGQWVCANGVCTLDPNAILGFATKALCEAALIGEGFEGGQCVGVQYRVFYRYTLTFTNRAGVDTGTFSDPTEYSSNSLGPLRGVRSFWAEADRLIVEFHWANGVIDNLERTLIFDGRTGSFATRVKPEDVVITRVESLDGSDPLACGSPPKKCPP